MMVPKVGPYVSTIAKIGLRLRTGGFPSTKVSLQKTTLIINAIGIYCLATSAIAGAFCFGVGVETGSRSSEKRENIFSRTAGGVICAFLGAVQGPIVPFIYLHEIYKEKYQVDERTKGLS